MKIQSQNQNDRLNEFYIAMDHGKECLETAGRLLVSLIDEDPTIKGRILDEHPEMSEDLLETFERIGRKQLYYKLALSSSPGIKALRRCPYSEQVKFYTEPIPLLLLNGRDSTDSLQVSVHALNSDQARQSFGPHRIRTLSEQRAFLERERVRPVSITKRDPYTISKGRITFHSPVTLTASDMARLLAEITL